MAQAMTERRNHRTSLMVTKSLAKEAHKAAIDADMTLREWVERAIQRALEEQYRRGRRHEQRAPA